MSTCKSYRLKKHGARAKGQGVGDGSLTDHKSARVLTEVCHVVIGEDLSELHHRYVTAAVRVHGSKP